METVLWFAVIFPILAGIMIMSLTNFEAVNGNGLGVYLKQMLAQNRTMWLYYIPYASSLLYWQLLGGTELAMFIVYLTGCVGNFIMGVFIKFDWQTNQQIIGRSRRTLVVLHLIFIAGSYVSIGHTLNQTNLLRFAAAEPSH